MRVLATLMALALAASLAPAVSAQTVTRTRGTESKVLIAGELHSVRPGDTVTVEPSPDGDTVVNLPGGKKKTLKPGDPAYSFVVDDSGLGEQITIEGPDGTWTIQIDQDEEEGEGFSPPS